MLFFTVHVQKEVMDGSRLLSKIVRLPGLYKDSLHLTLILSKISNILNTHFLGKSCLTNQWLRFARSWCLWLDIPFHLLTQQTYWFLLDGCAGRRNSCMCTRYTHVDQTAFLVWIKSEENFLEQFMNVWRFIHSYIYFVSLAT